MSAPFALGNILKITLRGIYNSTVLTNNVFHYIVTAVDGSVGANNEPKNAGYALWYFLKDPLLAITGQGMLYKSLTTEILAPGDFAVVYGEDYIIAAGGDPGTIVNEMLPPFVTWTFKLVRPSTVFRHGWKRFAGVTENAQSEGHGTLTGSLYVDVADQLEATIAPAAPGNELTSDARMRPIVYRAISGGEPVEPVEFDYPLGAAFNGIGSQNSRKYGHGV